MTKKATGPETVRVFPMPVAPLDGVPHKVMDVTPEEAARLTAPESRHAVLGVFVADPSLLPPGYQPPDPDNLLVSTEGTGPSTPED